jgi:hypothetical protein
MRAALTEELHMTEAEFRDFISRSNWKFARTMAHSPHEYTLRERAADDDEFWAAVMFIREHGYTGEWGKGKARYRYFDVDGKQYWTMGNSYEVTKLINRADVGTPTSGKRVDEQTSLM